jgi:hypothetical protein
MHFLFALRRHLDFSRLVSRSACVLLLTAVFAAGTDVSGQDADNLPTIERVTPEDVLPDESTLVRVFGRFRADTVISVEGIGALIGQSVLVEATRTAPGIIQGYAPPLDPGDPEQVPGWRALRAEDSRGSYLAEFVILYVPADTIYIKSAFPGELPTAAGTPVYFYGRNFHANLFPVIGGVPCTNPVLMSSGEIRATAPALDPHFVGVPWWAEFREVDANGGTLAYRGDLFLVTAGTRAPRPTSIFPSTADPRGGTAVTIRGQDFRPDTVISFGRGVTRGLADPGDFRFNESLSLLDAVFVSNTTITGVIPELSAGLPLGRYDVAAFDARGQRRLVDSLEYAKPIELTSVAPVVVSTTGGETVTFNGSGFEPGFELWIDDTPLLDVVFESSTRLVGTTPTPLPLDPGNYPARVVDPNGTVLSTLDDAIDVVAPPPVVITSVTPSTISEQGGAELVFEGTDFTPDLVPRLSGVPLDAPVFVDTTRFRGVAPALAPGLYDAELALPEGEIASVLPDAVEVLATPVELLTVAPESIPVSGFESVVFGGSGFRPGFGMMIGDVALVDVIFESDTELAGSTPTPIPLAPGIYAAHVVDVGGAVLASLEAAIEVVGLPAIELSAVRPSVISTSGGEAMEFEGTGFQADFSPRLGGVPLENFALIDQTLFRGVAPRLEPGVHDAEIVDAEGEVVARLAAAVEVVENVSIVALGPTEIEATLAQGTARFSWFNPMVYQQIAIRDQAGGLLSILDGNAQFYEVPANGSNVVRIKIEALLAGIIDPIRVDAAAIRPNCEFPKVLGAPADIAHKKYDFTLWGGNTLRAIPRCVPGPGDGGGFGFGGEVNEIILEALSRIAGNGSPHYSDYIGNIVSDRTYAEAFRRFQRPLTNRLVTGFHLPNDVDRLFIQAHYAKLEEAFGLRLKGRLVHVFPNDGFVDEFTFPDVSVQDKKSWNGLTYYRAERDVLEVADAETESCGLPIPAGEYVFELFAEGGDSSTPYYVVSSDNRPHELQIPGTPCPPYPLVEIQDASGVRTLPDITSVTATEVPGNSGKYSFAQFTAHGAWFDENGVRHSIVPGGENYTPNHGFEFIWRIHDVEGGSDRAATTNNPFTTWVHRIGCYEVEVTVRDRSCNRKVRRSFEVAVLPLTLPSCDPRTPNFSIVAPAPDVSSVFAVTGIRQANGAIVGQGEMVDRRRLYIRTLVIPPGCCGSRNFVCNDHPSAIEGDIEFRLLAEAAPGLASVVIFGPAPMLDLCQNIVAGPKYFLAPVNDLGALPVIPAANGAFRRVVVQGRTKRLRTAQNPFNGIPVDEPWRELGPSIRVTNRPDSLVDSYWRGYFSTEDQTYHFITRTTENSVSAFGMPPTKAVRIPLPKLPILEIPSLDNSLAAGLGTEITLGGDGQWNVGPMKSPAAGELLGNKIDSRPLEDEGKRLLGRVVEETTFSWEECETILEHSFEKELFRALIFSGTIGPVPVTIWATVGLGIEVAVRAGAGAKLSPFAPLIGQHFFEGDLWFDSSLKVTLPAKIRADIFFGVVSYIIGFEPSGTAEFIAHLGAKDTDLEAEFQFRVLLSLAVRMELCVLYLICTSTKFTIFDNLALVDERDTTGGRLLDAPGCEDDERRAIGRDEEGLAFGVGGRDTIRIYFESFHPVAATSPDAQTALDVSFRSDGRAVVRETNVGANPRIIENVSGTAFSPPLLDPSISFLTNDLAMIASTASFPEQSGIAPLPEPGANASIDVINRLKSEDEITVTIVARPPLGNFALGQVFRVADPLDEAPNPEQRRVDGRASIAGDVVNREAVVAWVRYETPDFIIEEAATTTIAEPLADGSQGYREVTVPLRRPSLERTAIYTRFVDAAGTLLGPALRISEPGINIEPVVAFSPTGSVAYCVWVYDGVHTDLIRSNRGRNLMYSVWSRATDSWSAPQAVMALPDSFPGALEPTIALRADGNGVLGFTALPADAPEGDYGYSNRYLHISRLIGGEFGEPELLRGACEEPVIGHWMQFSVPQTGKSPRDILYGTRNPDWVINYQRGDVFGKIGSAGGVAVSVLGAGQDKFSPPILVSQEGILHSNVAATILGGTRLHALALNSGSAIRQLSSDGVAFGVDAEPFFETISADLDPDLAIVKCELSDAFAPPGAFIEATIDVRNLGFAGSAETPAGESVTGLELVLLTANGGTEVVWSETLDILQPGDSRRFVVTVETPHEPVRFMARVAPNPIDRDRSNDGAICLFGAPAPSALTCTDVDANDEEGAPKAAKLSWTLEARYDEILLYRDGSQFKSLPGDLTSYIDMFVDPGEYTYEVRGRVGSSISMRESTTCTIREPGSSSGGEFRRGDQDLSGKVDISDPIATLSYLFIGGKEPVCFDAADADDSGSLQITDPIRVLNYLFLGGIPPAAPGPEFCGEDPSEDSLAECPQSCTP